MLDLAWLIPALPLAGAAANLFLGRRLGRRSGWLASALVAAAFAVAAAVFLDLVSLPAEERVHAVRLFEWIGAGGFSLDTTVRVDPLSMTMALVVTGQIDDVCQIRDDLCARDRAGAGGAGARAHLGSGGH